jgi:hypothetical protein
MNWESQCYFTREFFPKEFDDLAQGNRVAYWSNQKAYADILVNIEYYRGFYFCLIDVHDHSNTGGYGSSGLVALLVMYYSSDSSNVTDHIIRIFDTKR